MSETEQPVPDNVVEMTNAQTGPEAAQDTVEAPLTLAEQRAALKKELKQIEQAGAAKAKAEAAQKKVADREGRLATRAKEEAELRAQPMTEFEPDQKQIETLRTMYSRTSKINMPEPSRLQRLIPGWEKRTRERVTREAEEANAEKLELFQEFVKRLPPEAQKDGLAEYLGTVFDTPQEAVNLLAGEHAYGGRKWKEGTLSYKAFDHIQLPDEPAEPGEEKAKWGLERQRQAVMRRSTIVSGMKQILNETGLEPPIDMFQQAFAEKQPEEAEVTRAA